MDWYGLDINLIVFGLNISKNAKFQFYCKPSALVHIHTHIKCNLLEWKFETILIQQMMIN